MKALSFGEILWDVYPDKKFIGGAPLNFAAHLAKQSERVYMLSCIGNDDLGDEALLQLNEWGICTDFVSRAAQKQTGQCLVTLDQKGVPSYYLKQDVAYDYIDCATINGQFDVLYFGTLALRSKYNFSSLGRLLESQKFGDVFVDINIRSPFYSPASVDFCTSNATILKISLEELPIVAQLLNIDEGIHYSEFAKRLAKKQDNLKLIIITLGADGAYCYDCQQEQEFSCPSQNVEVASTVGAGDSFSAAFLHQLYKGKDVGTCLEWASKVAAFVVSKYEAVPEYDGLSL